MERKSKSIIIREYDLDFYRNLLSTQRPCQDFTIKRATTTCRSHLALNSPDFLSGFLATLHGRCLAHVLPFLAHTLSPRQTGNKIRTRLMRAEHV